MFRTDSLFGIYHPSGFLCIHQGSEGFRAVGVVRFDAEFSPQPDVGYTGLVWDDCLQCSQTSHPHLNIPKIDLQIRFGDLAPSPLEVQDNDFAPLLNCICSFSPINDCEYVIRMHSKSNPFHKLVAVDEAMNHAFIELDFGKLSVSPLMLDDSYLNSLSIADLLQVHSEFTCA